MAQPVTMPQLGETVVEGTIVKWLKSEGDRVERDEPLFEISTDKVDTEVPSPIEGVIKEILVQEGETVEVGTELAVIESDGEATTEAAPAQEAAEPEPEAGARAEEEEGPEARAEEEVPEEAPEEEAAPEEPAEEPKAEEPKAEEPKAEEPKAEEPKRAPAEARQARLEEARAEQPAPEPDGGPRSHILSPLVRRLADEHGVDPSRVRGTGTGGRVTKRDILAYVESGAAERPAEERPAAAAADRADLRAVPEEETAPAPPTVAAPAAGEREETRPISHIRRRIAENMTAVLQNTARAWNMVEVNMEGIARVRQRAKNRFRQQEGFSLTYMPFLARAVSDALRAFPDVNSTLNLEEGTATYRNYVNLGIAVAYEDGLIVPIVKDADSMNLVGLARTINDVATRARSKKLKPDEVHGGTFTITNPGPFGSIISVPIMNPGETAILAFDAVEKRPVVVDDAIAIRHMVYLSMSWDHRMIDGATASQFLARLKENLETWDFGQELQAYTG